MNKIVRKSLCLTTIVLLFASLCVAQFPGYKPTPGDTLKSIRISADNKVTLSIYAPKASEVSVSGDFLQSYGGQKLQKEELGIWSVTVGPVVPDLYTYDFSVDGIKVIDPKNTQVKEGANGYSNLLEVQGKEAEAKRILPLKTEKIQKRYLTNLV